MVDKLDSDGLTVKTLTEIVTDLETSFKSIYGSDINLDSNSPDGQIINIFAQATIDLRELLVSINAGFDPDQASGRLLDERVVINNIVRKGGTFTTQPIDVTVDQNVTLDGLDSEATSINGVGYTIQDDAGNQFILIDTISLTPGTTTVNFRAKNIGKVETTIGTITNPVNIVLGVVSVNNSSGTLDVGADQETDAELRLRREKSVSIASSGYLNGLEGALLDLDTVTDAKTYENVTNVVDANGIPAHGTWSIVEGGSNTDIANEIYNRKSYGSDLKGSITVDIATAIGGTFTAKFDRPVAKNLHIRFDINKFIATAVFDEPAIKADMVTALTYSIGQLAETSRITAEALTAITNNGGQGVPINVEISDDGITWVDVLNVTTLDEQFVTDSTRITITVV